MVNREILKQAGEIKKLAADAFDKKKFYQQKLGEQRTEYDRLIYEALGARNSTVYKRLVSEKAKVCAPFELMIAIADMVALERQLQYRSMVGVESDEDRRVFNAACDHYMMLNVLYEIEGKL